MLRVDEFYSAIVESDISFFTGVPDSLLKDFCAYITDHTKPESHIIAANEGNAVGLAAGHFLATGNPALVYMQNSGLGNAVNPLTSLVDPDVYSIPLLLVIGWRGEPGIKDEPQHVKQGKITIPLLQAMDIQHCILPDDQKLAVKCLNEAVHVMRAEARPFALVVRKGTFEPYRLKKKTSGNYEMSREDAIKIIASHLKSDDVVVSTTGKASRELFEYRVATGQQDTGQDFLTVGSMGHASQIAMGIAFAKPKRNVYCLDGDGSLIMHMGALAIIGSQHLVNFKHLIINNQAHDSVGGQPTVGNQIDIPAIAKACGYKQAWQAETGDELLERLELLQLAEGPVLLEIRVNKGARTDLGRPTSTPIENKMSFMRFLGE